jgi:hypothetical protein
MSRTARRLMWIVLGVLVVAALILLFISAEPQSTSVHVDDLGPHNDRLVATYIRATVVAKTQAAGFERAVTATAIAKTQAVGR